MAGRSTLQSLHYWVQPEPATATEAAAPPPLGRHRRAYSCSRTLGVVACSLLPLRSVAVSSGSHTERCQCCAQQAAEYGIPAAMSSGGSQERPRPPPSRPRASSRINGRLSGTPRTLPPPRSRCESIALRTCSKREELLCSTSLDRAY